MPLISGGDCTLVGGRRRLMASADLAVFGLGTRSRARRCAGLDKIVGPASRSFSTRRAVVPGDWPGGDE